jgi:hypothetical protein
LDDIIQLETLGASSMQSPLSRLRDVFNQVKSSADKYRPPLTSNESMTRSLLIDPVLSALGWDLANPDMVVLEKPVGNSRGTTGKLDYFLIGDSPIVIEAKKLGGSLEDHFEQVLKYAIILRVGVKNIFLTDGLKWIHYTVFDTSEHETKEEFDFGTLEGIELTKAAAYFIQKLDAALYSAHKPQKNEDVFKNKFIGLEIKVKELERLVLRMPAPGPSPIIEPEPDPWLIIGDSSWDPTNRKPSKLRLPNGEIVAVNSWSQVLSKTCEFSLSANPVLTRQLPIPDRTAKTKKLIASVKPPSNQHSDTLTINGEVMYVHTTYSANEAIANAAYILTKAGIQSSVKAAVILTEKPLAADQPA